MGLSKQQEERFKILKQLRKDAGNGKGVMSDSERLELSGLIQDSSGKDVKGQTISGQGNASSGTSVIGNKQTSTAGSSAVGSKGSNG